MIADVQQCTYNGTDEQLRTILDNVTDAIITMDSDCRITTFNATAEKIFQYSANEVFGQNVSILMPEPYRSRHDAYVESYLDTGKGKIIGIGPREVIGLRKNGSTFPLELAINVTQQDGELLFIGVARDCTQRKKFEAALAESEATHRLLFENSPTGIIVHSHGIYVFANRAAAAILGAKTPEEIIGKSIDKIIPSDQIQKLNERILSVKFNKVAITEPILTKVRRLDGRESVVESVMAPLPYDGVTAIMVHFRDVTEREILMSENKRLEAEMQQGQKMQSLGTLAGGIAHEFNNLLVPIIGLTEVTMDCHAPESPEHSNLTLVLEAALRAGEIIKRILAFSRQSPVERKRVSLRQALLSAFDLLRPTLPATVRIELDVEENRFDVYGSEVEFQQILMNLCSNAVYAIGRNIGVISISLKAVSIAASRQVQLEILPPGKYAHLTVRDNGSGIDAATLERIFEPFFTTKPVGEGTGLGLAVIHGIMISIGGIITASSELGKGACFDIYLPIADETGTPVMSSASAAR